MVMACARPNGTRTSFSSASRCCTSWFIGRTISTASISPMRKASSSKQTFMEWSSMNDASDRLSPDAPVNRAACRLIIEGELPEDREQYAIERDDDRGTGDVDHSCSAGAGVQPPSEA